MTKQEIIESLHSKHYELADFVNALSDKDFEESKNEKWSPGQQLKHVEKAVSTVSLGLLVPKSIVRLIFGNPNRASRDYETLVLTYQQKLGKGAKASKRYIPKFVGAEKKKILSEKMKTTIQTLTQRLDRYSDDDLNSYIFPHPILGKLTVREMLYFTNYHVQHHMKHIQANLDMKK